MENSQLPSRRPFILFLVNLPSFCFFGFILYLTIQSFSLTEAQRTPFTQGGCNCVATACFLELIVAVYLSSRDQLHFRILSLLINMMVSPALAYIGLGSILGSEQFFLGIAALGIFCIYDLIAVYQLGKLLWARVAVPDHPPAEDDDSLGDKVGWDEADRQKTPKDDN